MLLSYPNPSSPAQRGREYDGSEPYPQARCPSGEAGREHAPESVVGPQCLSGLS